MKYNAIYDRWATTGGLVYRYSKTQDKLILVKQSTTRHGYKQICCKSKTVLVHRLVWETFNGEIPDGYEIDHIDTNKENNELKNIRVCTSKENQNNPITLIHRSESHVRSEFGFKFLSHFGFSRRNNVELYKEEKRFYEKNKRCSWEENNEHERKQTNN